MEGTVFWDITLCNLVEIYRRFGGKYYLHLKVRISRAGKKVMLATCFFAFTAYSSTLKIEAEHSIET
jgi:hypothetical protein